MNDKLIKLSQSNSTKLSIYSVEFDVYNTSSFCRCCGFTLHCKFDESKEFIQRWHNLCIDRSNNPDNHDYNADYNDYYLRKYNLDKSEFIFGFNFIAYKTATVSTLNAKFEVKQLRYMSDNFDRGESTAWIYADEID